MREESSYGEGGTSVAMTPYECPRSNIYLHIECPLYEDLRVYSKNLPDRGGRTIAPIQSHYLTIHRCLVIQAESRIAEILCETFLWQLCDLFRSLISS